MKGGRHSEVLLVAPARIELTTNGLGNRCSIQLSYGAVTSTILKPWGDVQGDESLSSAPWATTVESRESLTGPVGRACWSLTLGGLGLEFPSPALLGLV